MPEKSKKKKEKTAQEEYLEQFRKPKLPDDFDDKADFLKHITALFDADLQYDDPNRSEALEDARFMVGDQWDANIVKNRQAAKRPTMVFNRLPAFVGQIIGNRRLNETVIKVVADDDAYKKSAKLREGLIRSIQKNSKAEIAYNKALENQVISGMGNIELCLDYAFDDVFEQDIKIKAVNNSLSVVWDRFSEEPTGLDAEHVFVVDTIDRNVFKTLYPDAQAGDLNTNIQNLGYEVSADWLTRDEVRIVDFWRMRSEKRIVALVEDVDGDGAQDVQDITDVDFEEIKEKIVSDKNGMPVVREVDRRYAEMYTVTATDVLEGPYRMPIYRVPLYRVPGWDINVGEVRSRFGLIRFLKDPQRLHNFWRSTIAEKLQNAPKATWLASDECVEGFEQTYRESHLTDDPLLIYNSEAGSKPERVDPPAIEGALIQEANMAAQDLRDISNLHEASLGQRSNEVSGRAILARQRVGETGTVIYQDNLNLAIEEIGRTINELIPHVYNTSRTIKILGSEGDDYSAVKINGEVDEGAIDITKGKYTITSTTGPSFVTKRVEAGESMLNMVNAMPDTLAVAADKIIEAQDWPGAEEIARRIRLNLPPGFLKEEDLSDEQKKRQVAMAEAEQIKQQKEDAILMAKLRESEARAAEAEARAQQELAKAFSIIENVDIDKFKVLADAGDSKVSKILEAYKVYSELTAGEPVKEDEPLPEELI